ncbi:MAG: DMT family transporter [Pseudomonadota bacterium]
MNRATALGVGAALFSVAIWANFLVTTGGATAGGLGVVELGLIRAGLCSAVCLPFALRVGLYPKGMPLWRFLVMTIGASAGFLFLVPYGFTLAPPADSGIFAPGTLPLWSALVALIFLGERISALRWLGFLLIAAGVMGVGGFDALSRAGDGVWIGYLCFMGGSFFFAFYAAAQRNSGLNAVEATAMVNVWTLPVALVVSAIYGVDFSPVGVGAIAWVGFAQFCSGVVAVITFTYAAQTLGPSKGAAFIALTPAVVAVASDWFLGQPASSMIWVGVAVVSVGVLIASGVFDRREERRVRVLRAPPPGVYLG